MSRFSTSQNVPDHHVQHRQSTRTSLLATRLKSEGQITLSELPSLDRWNGNPYFLFVVAGGKVVCEHKRRYALDAAKPCVCVALATL